MIAAGGTAGHVVPALAVAAALQAEGAEVSFIGGERAEAQLVGPQEIMDRLRIDASRRVRGLGAIQRQALEDEFAA